MRRRTTWIALTSGVLVASSCTEPSGVDHDGEEASTSSSAEDAGLPDLPLACTRTIEGDVVLETWEDAEALADVVEIEGLLAFEDTDWEGLPDLPCLRRIGGGMYLWRNLELRTLGGLSNLEEIGGGVKIDLHPKLEELGWHNLRSATGLNLFRLDALEEVDLPALETATAISVWHCPSVTDLSTLGQLRELDYLSIFASDSFTGVHLPRAAEIEPLGFLELQAESIESLAGIPPRPARLRIDRTQLTDLSGLVFAEEMTLIELTRMPELTSVGELSAVKRMPTTQGDGFTHLNIDENPKLTSLAGLESLEEVEGHVSIQDNAALADVSAIAGIASLTGNLWIGGSEALTSLGSLTPSAPGSFVGIQTLDVRDNTLLPTCDAVAFADALAEHGSLAEGAIVTIHGNAVDDCGGGE